MSRSGKEGTNNNWHERAADTALHALKTTANGLSQTEAATRLETHGPNRLPEAAKRSALLRFLLHFHNVLIYVLLGCAGITMMLDHLVDTLVIVAVVFTNKIICRPNSFVAQDMVRSCIEGRDSDYSLHRLGITMHVYADTWAHQGFAGINNKVNEANNIYINGKKDMKITNRLKNFFISSALPLGHGAVLSHPDQPYLKWSYRNGLGERIRRDNPKDFLEAADHMCRAMQRYQLGNPDAVVPGLPREDKRKIGAMLCNIKSKKGDIRHERWLMRIEEGYFSFGAEKVKYVPKGASSWKHRAVGTKKFTDHTNEIFKYKQTFPKSNWKMFHDALQAHRFTVLHDILPRYEIIAA